MTKILIIEDEAEIRNEVMDWLTFEGYEVSDAANGKLGLEAIKQSTPDLILCDIAMPELNGREVLIEVRSKTHLSHIPFIFLTAASDRDSIRKGMELGADDYLTKPFTHAEVLKAVRSRLERKAIQERQVQTQIDTLVRAFDEEHEKRLLKSRLVAMFSHDFRNPLAGILAASGILRSYNDRLTPEQKTRHYDRIDGAVKQLLQMLDDMLIVAEIESGHLEFSPETLNASAFAEGIIDEFRLIDQNRHQIILETDNSDSILADPKLIRQIIANLISNALKYSPADTHIHVNLKLKDSCLMLTVEDQGIGIPEASLPQLFEPFHRAANAKQFKGTGLGLSIVKNCVERHQGNVKVESQVGKGTCFSVQLPVKLVH